MVQQQPRAPGCSTATVRMCARTCTAGRAGKALVTVMQRDAALCCNEPYDSCAA